MANLYTIPDKRRRRKDGATRREQRRALVNELYAHCTDTTEGEALAAPAA